MQKNNARFSPKMYKTNNGDLDLFQCYCVNYHTIQMLVLILKVHEQVIIYIRNVFKKINSNDQLPEQV